MTIYTIKKVNSNKVSVYTPKNIFWFSLGAFFFSLFLLAIIMFFLYYSYITEGNNDFKNWFVTHFFIISFGFAFTYTFIFVTIYSLKRPKKFIGELISKEKDKDGNYMMTFSLDELSKKEIFCYTKEENTFKIYNKYVLYIKENSQIIKSIEEYNEETDKDYKLSSFTKYLNDPNTEAKVFLIPFIIVIMSMAIAGILTLVVSFFTKSISLIYLILIEIVTIVFLFILYAILPNMKKK